jgi:CDP-diacylglycerol--glycerol-3-phosphate 3-phosphatidyltransferase
MALYAIKPRFHRALRGTAEWLAARGTTPDQITTAGIVASLGGGAALATGHHVPGAYLAVPALALGRTAANALDGMVAQLTGTGRPAGELYNEIADRLGDAAFLAGAGAVPGVPAALAASGLAAAELASFVGVTARAAGGARRYDGPMGKPDRMLVLGAAGLAAAFVRRPARVVAPALATIAVGSLVTAANRYRHAHADLTARGDNPTPA